MESNNHQNTNRHYKIWTPEFAPDSGNHYDVLLLLNDTHDNYRTFWLPNEAEKSFIQWCQMNCFNERATLHILNQCRHLRPDYRIYDRMITDRILCIDRISTQPTKSEWIWAIKSDWKFSDHQLSLVWCRFAKILRWLALIWPAFQLHISILSSFRFSLSPKSRKFPFGSIYIANKAVLSQTFSPMNHRQPTGNNQKQQPRILAKTLANI